MDKVIIKFEGTPCHHVIISLIVKFPARDHFNLSPHVKSISSFTRTSPMTKKEGVEEKERDRRIRNYFKLHATKMLIIIVRVALVYPLILSNSIHIQYSNS